jgi:hypothetical protein
MYVKGETQVWCDGQDPYYSDVSGSTLRLRVQASEEQQQDILALGDERLQGFQCDQEYGFYDDQNAISHPGPCGPKVMFYSAWLQVVSPRVVYLRRYYDATDPYLIDDQMHCRIFETGYLRPLGDVLDLDSSSEDL